MIGSAVLRLHCLQFCVCTSRISRLHSSRKGRKILVVQTRRLQMDRCVCADCGSDHQQQRNDGERLHCGSGARHFRLPRLFWITGFARFFWFFWLGDGFDGYRHLCAYAIVVGVRNCGPAPLLEFASITSSAPLRTAVMVMFWLTASKAFLFPTACIALSI